MNVTFLDTLAGLDFVFVVGRTYDLDDEKALKWIAAGLCRKVDQPKAEQADHKPVKRTATKSPAKGE